MAFQRQGGGQHASWPGELTSSGCRQPRQALPGQPPSLLFCLPLTHKSRQFTSSHSTSFPGSLLLASQALTPAYGHGCHQASCPRQGTSTQPKEADSRLPDVDGAANPEEETSVAPRAHLYVPSHSVHRHQLLLLPLCSGLHAVSRPLLRLCPPPGVPAPLPKPPFHWFTPVPF